MNRICLTAFLYILTFVAQAQFPSYRVPDSLMHQDYEYFRQRYQATKTQTKAALYANTWLAKSKMEKNYTQMALAYQAVMHKKERKYRLLYTDSILNAALLTKDDEQIAAAFLTKGSVYYDLKKYSKALDNYLTADEYVSKTKNEYLAYKTKYTIAQTKLYLGFYDEAMALFTECLAFFKEENDRAHLNTIHSLALCYNKKGQYHKCSQYNQMGIELGREYEIHEMEPYFNHSEGINQYFLHNYKRAIELINVSMPTISTRKDIANEIVGKFYIGKAYLAMEQYDKAMPYFLKVEADINKENFFRPDLRENYEILIDFYKQKGDIQEQLKYVNRLLEADKPLNTNFRYLSTRIHKEYDTKKLLEDKDAIEVKLRKNKIKYASIIVLLVSGILYLIHRHFKNLKIYRQKFDELMKSTNKTIKTPTKKEQETDLEIAPEVIEAILKKLEKFEQSKKFIEKDMTTGRLADILHTNSKYISQIIPKYRGKRTFEYIRDLKIEYVIHLLKTEKIYRNYTNKALAELVGFGSTQNFTIAFKSRTDISPTYFIKELKKTIT